MSIIMTKDGWKQLQPQAYAVSGRTPTMLQSMGITDKYNGVKAMVDYANGAGKGMYFTYNSDGTSYQSKPAKHPLQGMFGEKDEEE